MVYLKKKFSTMLSHFVNNVGAVGPWYNIEPGDGLGLADLERMGMAVVDRENNRYRLILWNC